MPFHLEYRDLGEHTGRESWQGFVLDSYPEAWNFLYLARGRATLSGSSGTAGNRLIGAWQAMVLPPCPELRMLPSLEGKGAAYMRCQFRPDPEGPVPQSQLEVLSKLGTLPVFSQFCRNQLVELGMAGDRPELSPSLRHGMAAVVLSLAEHLDLTRGRQRLAGKDRHPGRHLVERGINWMMEHLDRPILLGDLADCLGVSPETAILLFRQVVGDSPVHYHQALRHREARRLLAEPGLAIKEIAWRLGFSDQYSFSRSFRGHVGQSPREYRRNRP